MKRGFLNTPRYKRAIDEAYAPAPVPEPEVASRGKPSTGKSPPGSQDAMDVDMPGVEEVYADGHVVAVRMVNRSAHGSKNGEPQLGSKSKGGGVKGRGKEKATETGDGDSPDDDHPFANSVPPRPTPGRRGWGRLPEEQFFRTVPESHGGRFKKRAIFRTWPRDPNGGTLMPHEKLRGTLSPDGYPWAETLYDLYAVDETLG